MNLLQQYFEAIEYRIDSGWDYQWQCFGPNAQGIDSVENPDFQSSVIFDRKTQTVYELSVCDYRNNRAYRWINPNWVTSYNQESAHRAVDADQAWDEVRYVRLETAEDFFDKTRAITQGEYYDTRVSVPLELNDDEMLRLMTMAHEQDITLNQLVEKILWEVIQKNDTR